jgi:hypothetical protein
MQLNEYILLKMGWNKYSESRGIRFLVREQIVYTLFDEDPDVLYFYDKKKSKKLYVIKKYSQQQNIEEAYKFITVDYNENLETPLFTVNEFYLNSDLFKLIMDNEAGNNQYVRHFRLNELLRH